MSAEIANGLLTHGRANAHVPLNEPGSQARHQTGTTMAKPRRASDNRLEQLQKLADILAAMQTDDELEGDMSGDDAVSSLSVLIPWARSLSDAGPAQIAKLTYGASPLAQAAETMTVALEVDAYRFTVEGFVHPCQPCAGTGEIIEYPPDDDERIVACPACGGTGEAITL